MHVENETHQAPAHGDSNEHRLGVWRRAEALKGESEKLQDPIGNTHN